MVTTRHRRRTTWATTGSIAFARATFNNASFPQRHPLKERRRCFFGLNRASNESNKAREPVTRATRPEPKKRCPDRSSADRQRIVNRLTADRQWIVSGSSADCQQRWKYTQPLAECTWGAPVATPPTQLYCHDRLAAHGWSRGCTLHMVNKMG